MAAAKTHLSLNVTDLDRSVAWYRSFFGTEPHKTRADYANFDLELPPLKLALNSSPHAGGGALNHLGILVEDRDTVLESRERLRRLGLEHSSEDVELCCHAVQTKVWAQDPDGNMWEIYTIEDDRLEDEAAAAEACCDSTCCEGACCP